MAGGYAAARLPIALHTTRGVPHRDSRDQRARKVAFDRPFAQLAGDQQLRLLEQLEKDEIALPSLSSKFFFDMLWRNTEEGFFADPLYGGNRDKVGWQLLGFPGVPSGQYRELVTSSEPYHAEPVSVLDIQTGKVPVDAEGFPKHVIIKRSSSTNTNGES